VNPTYLGIIVAWLVAAIVSLIDLSVNRDKGLYLRALPLCVLFMILDSAAAIMLFIPLHAGAEHLQNSTTATAVVAGLIGPLLMRTKFPVPFTNNKRLVNVVAMLRWLQVRIASEINDLCAVGETAWILDKVLPALRGIPMTEVEAWVIESINVKYSGTAARVLREKCIKDVRKVTGDAISEDERKHCLIQVLIDRCGRPSVIALVRRAKKQLKTTKEDPLTGKPSRTPIDSSTEVTNVDDAAEETDIDASSDGTGKHPAGGPN
jgi:hypothetical protein